MKLRVVVVALGAILSLAWGDNFILQSTPQPAPYASKWEGLVAPLPAKAETPKHETRAVEHKAIAPVAAYDDEYHAPAKEAHKTKTPTSAAPNDPHKERAHDHEMTHADVADAVRLLLGEMALDNTVYMRTHDNAFFRALRDKQIPRATVVMCSDSRVQTEVIDAGAVNDLFVIRNIGNQISSNEGSVEYGVHHLHTPLLLVLGHTRCGAVKAALSDYKEESPAIRRELDSLGLSLRDAAHSHIDAWLAGVLSNVHTQVGYAMQQYAKEVASGSLVIVGAVYDLAGDMGEGAGRLHIININGDANPSRIAEHPVLKSPSKE